jgi:hypothetical protein
MNEEKLQWEKATPQELPEPTYWPFFLALSVVLVGWGLLTIWLMSVVGAVGMGISLAGWINDLRYERRKRND